MTVRTTDEGQGKFRLAIDRVLERLDGVEGSGEHFRAYCPVHQPASSTRSRTSLAINSTDTGVGIYCHAGCSTADVVSAIDLELRDLFDQASPGSLGASSSQPSKKPKTTTLDDAVAFLARKCKGTVSVSEYPSASGQPFLIILRVDIDGGGKSFRQLTHHHGNTFVWSGPKGLRPLYRLPALLDRSLDDLVLVVEGEKCAESLRELDLFATTSAQGAKSATKTDWSPIAGRPVLIAADNDSAGRAFATQVEQLCKAAGASFVGRLDLPLENEGDDIVDFIDLLRADGGTDQDVRDEIQRYIDRATEVASTAAAEPRDEIGPDEPRRFPVSAFPRSCREMVEAGALAQSVDVGFWAVPMLPILAGCIGASRSVRLKAGWVEPSIIWAALVAMSGMGKSPGMRELMIPLRLKDRQLYEHNQERERQYREECATAKHNKQPLPELPPLLTAVVDDATIEALACRLEDNPRGIILANDELSGWIKSFDKYRSGGDDREKWLRIFDADTIKIDRKATSGGKRQALIPKAVVSVVGTTQPFTAAKNLTGDAQAAGLTPRLLVASPPVCPPAWTDEVIPDAVLRGWKRVVDSLLDLQDAPQNPHVLSLTQEARQLFISYHDANGLQQWQACEEGHGDTAAAIAKLRAYASRFALVIALAKAAEGGTASMLDHVDGDSMAAGIQIAEWFQQEARRCYASWSRMTPNGAATLDTAIFAKLREFGTLTTGQVRDKLNRNPSAAEVRTSLERLYSAGKVTKEHIASGARGGRPTEAWTHV